MKNRIHLFGILLAMGTSSQLLAAPTLVQQYKGSQDTISLYGDVGASAPIAYLEWETEGKVIRSSDIAPLFSISLNSEGDKLANLKLFTLTRAGTRVYSLKSPGPSGDGDYSSSNLAEIQISLKNGVIVVSKAAFQKWNYNKEGDPTSITAMIDWDFAAHSIHLGETRDDGKAEAIPENCQMPLVSKRALELPACASIPSHFMEREVLRGEKDPCVEISGDYQCEEFNADGKSKLFPMHVIQRTNGTANTYDLDNLPALAVADGKEVSIGGDEVAVTSCKRDLLTMDTKRYSDGTHTDIWMKRHFEMRQLDTKGKKFSFSERNWVDDRDHPGQFVETTNYYYTCTGVAAP